MARGRAKRGEHGRTLLGVGLLGASAALVLVAWSLRSTLGKPPAAAGALDAELAKAGGEAVAPASAATGVAPLRSRPLPVRPDRLLVGVGDRLQLPVGGRWLDLPAEARRLRLPLDLFEIWLPRGWEPSWIPAARARALARRGTLPVLVHSFFTHGISRERVERWRAAWREDLRRLARAWPRDVPALLVLEPEFNDAPPPGETRLTEWPAFGDELAAAARELRQLAPELALGVCAGDFAPDRDLDGVLARATPALDFLAFQEMRAVTDPDAWRPGYLDLGGAALDFARYLHRFGRPLLLAYAAVSSYGDWERKQAQALASLVRLRQELRAAGVFGVVYFQLRDDPEHSGYFGPAERAFGLLTAAGKEKPALAVLRRLAQP